MPSAGLRTRFSAGDPNVEVNHGANVGEEGGERGVQAHTRSVVSTISMPGVLVFCMPTLLIQ